MNSLPMTSPAIIFGLSPTSLFLIRELSDAGIPVIGVGGHYESARFSRHIIKYCHGVDQDDLVDLVSNVYDEYGKKPVLFPTSDDYVEIIGRKSKDLEKISYLQGSYTDGKAELFLNKSAFYKEVKNLGVFVPKIFVRKFSEDFLGDVDLIFPVLAKPAHIHKVKASLGGKKLYVIENRDRLEAFAPSPMANLGEWIIQELIPGPESEILVVAGYVDKNGDFHELLSARKVRQYPPGFGSASFVITEKNEDLIERSTDLIRSLGYQGIFAAEWKRDFRDNTFKMIEINPRVSLWFQIVHDTGKRLALKAYADLCDSKIDIKRKNLEPCCWRYASRDIYSALFYSFNKNTFSLPKPEASLLKKGRQLKKSWALWSQKDPLPAIMEPVNVIRKLWRRFFPK